LLKFDLMPIPASSSAASEPKRSPKQAVPEALIYELDAGNPIYYKGYQDVLSGLKNLDDIMGDSNLQAWLKLHIGMLLHQQLQPIGYVITSGEQGLKLGKGRRRDADIAVFRAENFVLSPNYSSLPPDAIVEIDVEADTSESSDMTYIYRKVADYFAFGVKQVVWIFTSDQKTTIFTPDQKPMTFDWSTDIQVLDKAKFNLNILLEEINQ